jgi:hypothetical protein
MQPYFVIPSSKIKASVSLRNSFAAGNAAKRAMYSPLSTKRVTNSFSFRESLPKVGYT